MHIIQSKRRRVSQDAHLFLALHFYEVVADKINNVINAKETVKRRTRSMYLSFKPKLFRDHFMQKNRLLAV